ncbi:hypothetical protein [Actinophytocola sediminis]
MSEVNSVVLDGVEFGIAKSRAREIDAKIKAAMDSGLVITLHLLNSAGREVTVHFNGGATSTAAIDFGGVPNEPRPTEISGSVGD